MSLRALLLVAISLGLAACASTGPATKAAPISHVPVPKAAGIHKPRVSPYAPAQEDLSKRGDYVAGGLFRPGVSDSVPDEIPDVDAIPEHNIERLEAMGRAGWEQLGIQTRVSGEEWVRRCPAGGRKPQPGDGGERDEAGDGDGGE